MMDAGRKAGMAIAPDRHGTGTNGLFLHLPTGFLPSFGPGSLERHVAAATSLGCQPAIVRRMGLALDIDDHADLAMLRQLDASVDSQLDHREAEAL
jgi:2-phospho-L-lactate guanylyltransferase